VKVKIVKPPIRHHHEQPFERLEKAEGWVSKLGFIIAAIIGAVVAIGLFTATGHITW
jgi:hypothetical protein